MTTQERQWIGKTLVNIARTPNEAGSKDLLATQQWLMDRMTSEEREDVLMGVIGELNELTSK